MRITSLFKIAVSNLLVNWLRSALTLLGMIFGTGAVIATLSSNEGSKQFIAGELAKLGTNILIVKATKAPSFNNADLAMVGKYATGFKSIALTLKVDEASLQEGARIVEAPLVGVAPSYFDAFRLPLRTGRYFALTEAERAAPVAVLGGRTASDLFGLANPVGRYVHLRVGPVVTSLRIVGVLRDKGVNSGINFDVGAFAALPFVRSIAPAGAPTTISATLADDDQSARAKSDMAALLKSRHGDSVLIEDARETLQRTQAIWRNQNLVGILLASVSLLTGGVGIMNVMFLSIHQRRREVGLRKAIGATDLSITLQFLFEAMVICFLGGLAGVGVGWLFGRQVAAMLGQWEAVTSPGAILMSLTFATLTGLFFGLMPAIRASRLDPYDALRSQ